ncbi:hypothetical protein IWQ61_009168, partial [Dispira simplex]
MSYHWRSNKPATMVTKTLADTDEVSTPTSPATTAANKDSIPVSPATSRPASPLSLHVAKPLDMKSSQLALPSAIDVDGLSWPSIGTKQRLNETEEEKGQRIAKISDAVKTIL